MTDFLLALKKALKIQKYPTADRNASFSRILLNAIPYFLSRSGYSFAPLSVFIHVNNRCNLKCKMCDAGQLDQGSMFYKNLAGGDTDSMPIETFKNIIDKIKAFRPFIGIPAMEPLLYPHIIEAIEYVRCQGLRCSIATNGTPLESIAEEIVRSGLTKIVISLDGPPRIHDRIRGVEGTYQQVLRGINKLYAVKRKRGKDKPVIYVNYVISEDNFDTIVDFIENLPLDPIRQVDFRLMFYCTDELAREHNALFGKKYDATSACLAGGIHLDKVNTEILYQQIRAVIDLHRDKCKFFFNYGPQELHQYYHEPEVFLDSTRCVFPWYTMQINTDGSVIPSQRCYHNIYGTIIQQNFQEIWNGKKLRDFRMDLRKFGRFPACTRCEGVNF